MPSGADLEYARLLAEAGRSDSPAGLDGARLFQLDLSSSTKLNALKEIWLNKNRSFHQVVTPAPVVALGVADAASTITNSVYIPETDLPASPNKQITSSDSQYFLYYKANVGYGPSYPRDTFISNNNAIQSKSAFGGYFGGMAVEFMFDGLAFEVTLIGNQGGYRFWVDDVPVTLDAQAGPPSNGSLYNLKCTFATRAVRKIRFECTSNQNFGGIRIGPNDTVWKPNSQIGPKVVVIGDSYTEGAGSSYDVLTGYVWWLGYYLGIKNIIASGIGGTGYVSDGNRVAMSGLNVNKVSFLSRLKEDVIDQKPDIVIFAGGINDESISSDISSVVQLCHQRVRESLPECVIITLSPFWPRSTGTPTAKINEVKAGSKNLSDLFIDVSRYFTGTGRIGAVAGTGNADLYISSDGSHPSSDGHRYLGERIATDILTWLDNYFS